MSGTATHSETATLSPTTASVDMKLEVVIIPVSDVDRAKRFYENLGWRLDADFTTGDDWRAMQLTPPGSQCSVIFGKGVTAVAPGSARGLFLVVDDLEAAREELVARGVDVSEVFHFEGGIHVKGTNGRAPGRDPEGRSYRSWVSFNDPDGNAWMIQEVKARLPGRGLSRDVATLTELLLETEEHHGEYEVAGPKHHWSTWYAAYIVARERGKTTEVAAKDAARHTDSASDHASDLSTDELSVLRDRLLQFLDTIEQRLRTQRRGSQPDGKASR